MIDKIFNSLSHIDLSDEDKLQGIATLFQFTVDNYTDDEGNVYVETFDVDLDQRDVQSMPLTELDNVVDKAAFGNNLYRDLLLLTNFAKSGWGASSASVVNGDGFLLFEVCYGDKNFKSIVDLADC